MKLGLIEPKPCFKCGSRKVVTRFYRHGDGLRIIEACAEHRELLDTMQREGKIPWAEIEPSVPLKIPVAKTGGEA